MRRIHRFAIALALSTTAALGAACPEPPDPPNEGEGEGEPGEGEGEGEGVGEGEGEGEGEDPNALDPAASTLLSDPLGPLPADGIAAYTITATLKSELGTPLPDLPVTFTADGGVLTAIDAASLVDGTARASLSSATVGSVTITATVTTSEGDVALTPLIVDFEGCRTPAQAFEQELYPKVFSRCQGCHNELGLARERGLEYVLPFPGVDNWAQRSVDVIALMATQIEPLPDGGELSRIVAKPMLLLDEGHEGGLVIVEGSEEERLIKGFANLLNAPDACAGVEPRADEALSRITLLSPRETFARAKVTLTGAVATPEEIDAMPDTEEALDAALDALLDEPAFEDRLAEMYADWFLTDRFTKAMGGRRVLNRNNQFTLRFFYAAEGTGNQQCDPATDLCCREVFDDAYCTGKEDALIETLAREPLEIIKRIVRDDLPISDAITLDHTFVTPLSARFYGFTDAQLDAAFDANLANDASETVAGTLSRTANNTLGGGNLTQVPNGTPYPHAGILTTHAMIARWPTTTSNKNRGRAQSIIMRRLLNIDVMKFAEFSTAELDPSASLDSATQTEIACTVCHSAVDPLAGLWQNFAGNGQYRVVPPSSQDDEMPAPGFLQDLLPDGDEPIRFAAERIVEHERFPLAMLIPVLTGLTGFEELDNSLDPLDPDVEEKALALEIQRALLADLRARFVANGLRVKPLVKDIVKHEIFRARGVDSSSLTDLERAALERAGIGRGVMITPEQLDRKLQSIFGFAYRANRSPTGTNLLASIQQYRILFGGLNYEAIAKRFRDPSPVLTRIVERMANEMSCIAVAQDFSITDPAQRRLFKSVEITDDDPALIRAELARLHRLLLEENPSDEELDATLAVFTDTLAAGRALVAAGGDDEVPNDCDATQSFEATPIPYPAPGRVVVRDDPDFIIRAWMASVSYLLSDPRFFTE